MTILENIIVHVLEVNSCLDVVLQNINAGSLKGSCLHTLRVTVWRGHLLHINKGVTVPLPTFCSLKNFQLKYLKCF